MFVGFESIQMKARQLKFQIFWFWEADLNLWLALIVKEFKYQKFSNQRTSAFFASNDSKKLELVHSSQKPTRFFSQPIPSTIESLWPGNHIKPLQNWSSEWIVFSKSKSTSFPRTKWPNHRESQQQPSSGKSSQKERWVREPHQEASPQPKWKQK